MLAELGLLLDASGTQGSSLDELRALVIDENVCGKPSLSTRRKTFVHLRELFGLDENIPLWRVTRFLWWQSVSERPLLALILAFARQPLLRMTWDVVAPRPLGQTLTFQELEAEIENRFPEHYSPTTRRSLARNCASAWAQSGHLTNTSPKKRDRAQGGAASMTLALYLSQLEGLSPARCFDSRWAALLDAPAPVLDEWAFEAHKRGWLDYRRIENVVHLDMKRLNDIALRL